MHSFSSQLHCIALRYSFLIQLGKPRVVLYEKYVVYCQDATLDIQQHTGVRMSSIAIGHSCLLPPSHEKRVPHSLNSSTCRILLRAGYQIINSINQINQPIKTQSLVANKTNDIPPWIDSFRTVPFFRLQHSPLNGTVEVSCSGCQHDGGRSQDYGPGYA